MVAFVLFQLTHWGRVTDMVISNPRNRFQGNLKQNSNIFIHENAFESVVCQMAAILYRPQCVKEYIWPDMSYTCMELVLLGQMVEIGT